MSSSRSRVPYVVDTAWGRKFPVACAPPGLLDIISVPARIKLAPNNFDFMIFRPSHHEYLCYQS